MKQFLYLDTDIVNSIIAQAEKGLINEFSRETTHNDSTSKSDSVETEASTGIKAKILSLFEAETKLAISGGWNSTDTQGSASREIASKSLHDAAFNIAYEHINPHNANIDHSFDECGNYIEITRVFTFVDLDYLTNLFSEDGLIDYMKKQTIETIEKKVDEKVSVIPNSQQNKNSKNSIKQIKRDAIKESEKEYNDMRDAMSMIEKILPCSKMLISYDGYLIPFDDKYFRIDPETIGFRYDGEMTCVGMITNIIGVDTKPVDNDDVFSTLQYMVNETLRSILPSKEQNLCVIHPIAVYYK